MMRSQLSALFLPVMLFGCASKNMPQGSSVTASQHAISSPSGRTTIHFAIDEHGAPFYTVDHDTMSLIAPSGLGLTFDAAPLTDGLRVVGFSRRSVDNTYKVDVPIKTSVARDHFNEATFQLEESSDSHRRVNLVFRAYDDGIAFRYVLPEQAALKAFAIRSEQSRFHFPKDLTAYALPLKNFTTSYENYYVTKPLSEFVKGELIGMPLLLHGTNGPWLAITEADLTDYAGMYLTPAASNDGKSELVSALTPLPANDGTAVRGTTPHATPWRVMMIADEPGKLIESTLILNLNPPSTIADTSWIHTGKILFPWWNGYFVPPGTPFKGDVNTPTLKYYIDFAAEKGDEFVSIDGNDEAWYGGPCSPWLGADVTKARPELNMDEVLAYAKSKHVRLRLWMHWAALQAKLDEALATYERWGIDGIMIDFMDRDDQEMVNFYHEVAKKAAAHHLTVNYHGAYKPTGMERTYPNVMNYEAVLNLEYNKWSNNQSRGAPPAHELTVPFIRMLAGPLDFHSGGMRSVKPADFTFQNLSPLVMGTRSHQLARYVIYENPLPMLADDPASYRGAAEFDLLQAVPTTWDETRVLAGAVGESIVIARRHGSDWWLGAMCADEPRTFDVPLSFLAAGSFRMSTCGDDLGAEAPATATRRTDSVVTANDRIQIRMASAGGTIARLTPRH